MKGLQNLIDYELKNEYAIGNRSTIAHVFTDNESVYFKFFRGWVQYYFPDHIHNFYFTNNIQDFKRRLKGDKVIVHGFPTGLGVLYWLFRIPSLKRSVWMLWGFDAYFNPKGIKQHFIELIRAYLIPKIPKIGCPVMGDMGSVAKRYDTIFNYTNTDYPIPTNFTDLMPHLTDYIRPAVLVCHSANPENNTLEILEMLADKQVKIIAFLNYGDKDGYAKKIKDYIDKHFLYYTIYDKFLDRKMYADIINDCDFYINNAERQIGLGTIEAFLYSGKKVFVSERSPLKNHFIRRKCHIYQTEELRGCTQDEMVKMSEKNRRENKANSLNYVNGFRKRWERIIWE